MKFARKNFLLLIILFIICIISIPSHTFAATIYTNYSTGNDTTGAGTSGSPYKTFNKAYTVSSNGDTLNLTGTFDWSNSDETGDAVTTGYTINKNLTIQGQSADTTIIQASSTENTATRRVFSLAASTTVTINDVTIRYGVAGSSEYGGGIESKGNVTIDSCDISYNRATNSGGGGGMNVWGSAIVQNSTIHHNVAYYMGGGLLRHYYTPNNGTPTGTSTLNIINSTISSNTVTSAVAYTEGGGVFYRRGEGSITNSTITLNQVTGSLNTSTHGLGTGDGAGRIHLKNNIIAGNVIGSSGGDIGHRENNYGTYADNGNNIIGRPGYYRSGYATSSSTWLDAITYNLSTDGTYVYQTGTTTTGTLSLDSALASNGTLNGTKTFAITSATSIAVNNGATGSNGSTTVPTLDQRGLGRVSTTDIGAYEYGASSDSTAPVISSIATTTATTTATITWTTDEAASTKINFGVLSGTYGTSTTETDTSTRVTSHTVNLTGLKECTRYHFQAHSTDGSSNTGTSTNSYFRTTGCTGSATVSSTGEGRITTASGGTLTEGLMTLTVPTSFTTSTSSATFQASLLESTSFFSSAGTPSGKSRTGSTVYNLKALTDTTTTLSSFDSALTLSLTYTDADVVGIVESSLLIYRYDGSTWSALSNCSVDTSAKSVTCTTTAFSDFSIFGTASVPSVSSSTGSSKGASIQSRVNNLRQMGNNELADKLILEWPHLFTNPTQDAQIALASSTHLINNENQKVITTTENVSGNFLFTRNLTKGNEGEDVKALQEFLIKSSKGPIASELKRVGVTGYFGSYTKNALGEFQRAIGILPHTGFFGPITRAYITEVQK